MGQKVRKRETRRDRKVNKEKKKCKMEENIEGEKIKKIVLTISSSSSSLELGSNISK